MSGAYKPNQSEGHEEDKIHAYYSTTDYDKFSLILYNRPVDEEKVSKFVKEFEEGKNYLKNFPINVTPDLTITDGQHRHAAARRAKVRLFYIVDEHFKMDDAIAANGLVGKWTTLEYMESFAKRNFPEYEKIYNFHLEQPWIKISTLPKLCSTKGYGKLNFNNGHYEADRMGYAHKVASMVNGFRVHIGDKQADYNQFLHTVMNLAQNPNYNHKRMMEKMTQRSSLFERCATVEQYLNMLTGIYNYRVSPENKVLLTEYFIHSRWKREDEQ